MTLQAPIVVVGGGPAGSACARQLALLGHAVRLLVGTDRTSQNRFGETGSPTLHRTLLAEKFSLFSKSYRPLPTFQSAWGSEEIDTRSFAFWQAGDGVVLDRKSFDAWLLDEAVAVGVDVIRNCHVISATQERHGWHITGRSKGQEIKIHTQFAIEATGRTARSVFYPDVRRFYSDQLVCMSLEIRQEAQLESTALIESTEYGWWYFARRSDGRSLVAWFTDADFIPPRSDRYAWFTKKLQSTRHTSEWVKTLPLTTDLSMWDARTSIRTVLWRERWVSIGDAAWALDPLSGSGVERAIKDGIIAGHVVSQTVVKQDPEPLRTLAMSHVDAFKTAIRTQRRVYQAETRFRASPFWQRRAD